MESPQARYINLAANDCGYDGKTKEFIFNWVHPLLLKAHSKNSKEDSPNWNHVMNGPFANGQRQAACTELENLEGMGAQDIVDPEDNMNVIRSTWAFKLI